MPAKFTPTAQERSGVLGCPRFLTLLGELDSDTFAVRQKATNELEKLGDLVEPALLKLLASSTSSEVRRRSERLLVQLEGWSAARSQGARAVEVLEHIGTLEAQQILEVFSRGAPEARLTRGASASLGRLATR